MHSCHRRYAHTSISHDMCIHGIFIHAHPYFHFKYLHAFVEVSDDKVPPRPRGVRGVKDGDVTVLVFQELAEILKRFERERFTQLHSLKVVRPNKDTFFRVFSKKKMLGKIGEFGLMERETGKRKKGRWRNERECFFLCK